MSQGSGRSRVALLALLSCGGIALWLGSQLHADSPQYFITNIGLVPRGFQSAALAINANGAAAGVADFHAAVYRDGLLQDIGTIGGTELDHSLANGITDAGVIAGESSNGRGVLHAFVFKDGTMTDLTPTDEWFSRARAINTREQIVGEQWPADGSERPHAFLYDAGEIVDLGTLGPDQRSQANALNMRDQVVGFSFAPPADAATTGPPYHAVLWENRSIVDLGTFGGSAASAWAINDAGQIAGTYTRTIDGVEATRAFVYDLRTALFTELPAPASVTHAFATGINSAGDVVGQIILGPSNDHAVVWHGGVMFDLNEVIPAGSGDVLGSALAINDAGQIAATGRTAEGVRGFILTPSSGAAWNSVDIGTTGLSGSLTVGADGIFTVRGAGADIWGTADSFHFVSQPLPGNGTIVARLEGMTGTHQFAKAGVMLRDGLGSGAAHVILNVKPDGDVEFMQRMSPSGDTAYLTGGHVSLPSWLRLTSDGSTITGSVSPDGISWTTVGVAAASFGANVQAGLAVTSHDPSQLNTARFGGAGVMPAPWIDRDVGTSGLIGNASFNGGTLTVKAAGSDIWSDADSFHYVYRTMPASGSITARVVALENTHMFAKAGIMIRETASADSVHVVLDVKPDGLVEFMQRSTTGGSTTYLAGGVGPWVRLERAGAGITASTSQDGATWTVIGSTTAVFSSNATGGIAVTSHDAGRLTSAVVDQVVVDQ